jgi:isoleucyl-tRNA synthetase
VSRLDLQPGATDGVTVARADGQKCARCWHWETDVGAHADHPALCGRCAGAVRAQARPA